MHYRSDIDGLRALAVLAILAFHAGLPLPGGFLGVDVFFVISGYLITSIMDRETGRRAFSLLGFYQRRVARILPALLLMLAVTCLIGCLVLLPGELRALCSSAVAAAGFASNLYFWRETAYFGGMAEARPLLHTWSLAVEEQFYLFYPLALPLALRWLGRAGTRFVLLVAAAASLTLCLVYARSHPAPVFYLLPGRVWEIGLGALAALGSAPGPSIGRPGGKARQMPAWLGGGLGSWLGLGLVIAALASARPDMIGQHLWAMAACTGTVLLLLNGRNSHVGTVLSIAPLRAIGLASYSIYLWHWPIFSLYRIVHGHDLDAIETGGLIAASLVLATLSYLLVERPLRRRLADAPARRVVIAGIVASITLAGAVLLVRMNADAVRDLPPDVRKIASFSDYWRSPPPATALERQCAMASRTGERTGAGAGAGATPHLSACPASTSDVNVLLAGDSHANHIRNALRYRFPADHIVTAIAMGCRPLVDAPSSRCTEPFQRALRTGIATGRIQAVVLAAQWNENEIGSLSDTIHVLQSHGARVIVVGPVVEYDGDFPRILARAMLLRDLPWVDGLRRRARQRLDRRMAIAVRATGARYFSAYDQECPDGRCRLFSSRGEPMHFDYGHYTRSASVDIVAGMPEP